MRAARTEWTALDPAKRSLKSKLSAAEKVLGLVTLLDSLLDAIVRLDGDALVMHVGEKPYVVTTSSAMSAYRGPLAWGQVELSSRVLTPDAVLSMVGQILPEDQRHALEEVGAVEHEIVSPAGAVDRFSVVAARGGDDIWLELRRHPGAAKAAADAAQPATAAAVAEPPPPVAGQTSAVGLQEPPAPPSDVASTSARGPEPKPTAPAAAEAFTPSVHAGEPRDAAAPDEAEGQRDERHIEERVPVLDEVTHDEAEHVEHFVIPVNGSDHAAADERDADAAMQLIEPEPQYVPTEEDVDAMLAATAASLLAANLKPGPPPPQETTPPPPDQAGFSPDSFEVVFEEDEAESDLTSALDDLPAAPWSTEPAPPSAPEPVEPQAAAEAGAGGLEALSETPSPVPPRDEAHEAVVSPVSEVEAVTSQPEGHEQAPQSSLEQATAEAPVALPAQTSPPTDSVQPPPAEPETAPAGEALGAHEAVAPHPPAPVPPPTSDHTVEFVPGDAVEDVRGEPSQFHTEIFVDTNAALPASPAMAPAHVHSGGAAASPDASRGSVVVPIGRASAGTVRPDAGGRVDDERLLQMLRVAAERGASTVYVVAQSKPMIRVDGDISALDDEAVLTAAEIERLVAALAPARTSEAAVDVGVEWISEVPQVGRVRCVTFRDHRGPGLIFRLTSATSISAEHLNLSPAIRELCTLADGLVLVAGARGSGKSTLVSSFVDLINRTRSEHVITVETEIGFVHESKRSFVSQREAPESGAAAAVSSALREDPDVLVIEDLQSPEVATAALHAAESGRLVIASITAPSSAAALDAFVNLAPESQRSAVRAALAGALRAVVTQLLLRKASGGRVTARELLLSSPAVSASIRNGDARGVAAGLDAGERYGMVSLNEAIAGLVRSGTVHATEGYRRAPDRQALLASLARDGVDTSFAERLA